jgi:hypothetical protein
VGQVEIVIDDTTNACPVKEITVVEEAVYDALFASGALGYVANAPVNVAQISGDSAAADNAEAFFDGTGYAGTNNVIPTVTNVTNLHASAATATALATAQADLDILTGSDGVTLATSQPNYAPYTGTPPTAAAIRAEIDSNSTQLAAILADTAEIGAAGAGLTAIPWNIAWDAEVQSECADALAAYDPPTHTELTTAFTEIKGATWSSVTDTLEALRDRGDAAWTTATGFSTLDAAGVRSAVGLASANLDTQLAALPTASENADAVWDEALAGHLAAGSTGEALNAAGAAGDPWTTTLPGSYTGSQAGKILSDILVDTGTTLQAELDGIQADTEDIQSRLPAALVSGRIDASVGAMAANTLTASALATDAVTEIQSGLATAASISALNNLSSADVNAACDAALADYDAPTKAELDAAFTEIKGATWSSVTDTLEAIRDRGDAAWTTATGFSTLDAAGVRTAVGLASANLDTQLAGILADTAEIGAAGAGLTAIPWNASWDAEVQSEVQDAIEANHLDHLLATTYDPATKPGAADALLNELIESDAGVSRFTANALEQGPSGGGGVADWTADERTAIRSILGIPAVGTTPDDPSTGILDTIRDAVGVVDGVVDAIKIKTDNLPAAPAATGDIPSASTVASQVRTELTTELARIDVATSTRLASAGYTAPLDAAGTRTALGMASANLDTQLAALPTALENADAVWDEVITGAQHNVNNSAAKFLRQSSEANAMLTGTAQSATNNTITLESGAVAANDILNGEQISIIEGTGVGQSRLIIDSAMTTDIVTVAHNWTVNPDATSVYAIAGAEVDIRAVAEQPVTATTTVDFDDLSTILVDTNELQTDWANGGRLDLILDARASQTSVDDIPTNAELTAALGTLNDLSAAEVRSAVGLASANLDTQLGNIVADTNELQIDWANGGRLDLILDARASQTSVDDIPTNAELTAALGALNDLSAAEVRSAVGLASANLDTQLATIVADTNELQTNQGNWATATGFSTHSAADVWAAATRTLTANTNLSIPTTAAIADAVWDEPTSGHATAGTTGAALTAAGSAGDPWATSVPGAYAAGTAGYIVGTNLNATVSSRATQTSVDSLTGAGSGSVLVDHDYGGTDELAYKTSGGDPIAGATVEIFLTSDYDGGNRTSEYRQGRTITDINGRWSQPVYLDPESYTVVFYKVGFYGPDVQEITVA